MILNVQYSLRLAAGFGVSTIGLTYVASLMGDVLQVGYELRPVSDKM